MIAPLLAWHGHSIARPSLRATIRAGGVPVARLHASSLWALMRLAAELRDEPESEDRDGLLAFVEAALAERRRLLDGARRERRGAA